MANMIAEMFGSVTDAPANPAITASMIAASAGAAQAYLVATLDSATPEVRRLFTDYLGQQITGQETLMALAVKKGWVDPYVAPAMQLQNSTQMGKAILS